MKKPLDNLEALIKLDNNGMLKTIQQFPKNAEIYFNFYPWRDGKADGILAPDLLTAIQVLSLFSISLRI